MVALKLRTGGSTGAGILTIIMKHRSIEQITILKCILQCMSGVKKSLMQETSHILNSVKYQEYCPTAFEQLGL